MIGLGDVKIIWDLLKEGYKLLKLKDKKLINDHNYRQDFLRRLTDPKTGKQPIVFYTEKGDIYLSSPDIFEQPLIDKTIQKQVNNESRDKSINLLSSEFQDRFLEYKQHFYKPDPLLEKIFPYLDDDFLSLLKLSSYVNKALDEDNYNEVSQLKREISGQYGKEGNKICTLYLRRYLIKMIKYYLNEKVDILEDPEIIKFQIKDLKNKIMEYSEYIFFIDKHDDEKEIIEKIKRGLEQNTDYIALHASGKNIHKLNDIFRKSKKFVDSKKYIPRITEDPSTKASIPVKDLVLKRRDKIWAFDFLR